MKWNLANIIFLYPPDVFTGSFDNAKMQARHEQQMQAKIEAIEAALDQETDPLRAMQKLHAKEHLKFFLNNEKQFRDAEKFEEAVLALYGKANSPFASGGDPLVWRNFFATCDRARLFNLGSPVTLAAATVYSGSVSGFQRSLSWTPERQKAEMLAERWKDPAMGGGKLYEMDIRKSHILVHLKHRHEEELILDPEFVASAEIRLFRPGS